ncbi:TonB-dependent receptor domain-containing protein [Caulobacter sp. KR2-114]|uniref:TonB-dependent receptor domain-containing protein n=1 Tax=Caulobacter sp. KR2-114 TaxID=3400912 RepID=UPI003BFD7B9A
MRVSTPAAVYGLGALISMFGADALAQSAPPASPAPSEPQSVQEVVVTGTRIMRRDYVSDSPMVTLGAPALASSGSSTLETSLNQLPQIASSASSQANFTSRAGQASVDLRGLGQQRTLVLVGGRRMQPSGADGTVDLNTIPTALVDNIEVITGGASAVYGSDAVTGVVNIKLKPHFSGVEVDARYGETGRGDGATRDLSLIVGGNFADDRGNAYVSLNYADRDAVAFTDRSYLSGQVLTANTPTSLLNVVASNLPSQSAMNALFAKYGYAAGTVKNSAVLSFNADGTLFSSAPSYNYKGSTAPPFKFYNGNFYTIAGDTFLAQVPLTRYNVVGHAEYRLTSNVRAYVDGLYTTYSVQTQGPPVVVGGATSAPLSIPVTNPFIPADLATLLASRPNPTANFGLAVNPAPVGNRHEQDQYNVYQLTAGLSGRLDAADLTWNGYVSVGATQQTQRQLNYDSTSAMNTLLQAADGGKSLCTGGYNPFGAQPISQGCINYFERNATNLTTLRQQIVEFDTQGRVMTLPAGELRFAAGVDYRNNSYSYSPDAEIQSGDLANYLPILPSSGSEHVTELYGELLAPILKDRPFIRALNLDLGYRYSDYNTVGGVSTYKADFDWKLGDVVGLRGGYAHATRAPSVGELYTAQTHGLLALGAPGVFGSGDPCDVNGAYRKSSYASTAQVRALCLAQGVPGNLVDNFTNTTPRTPNVTSGNTSLTPESSNTYSVGAVFTSRFSNPLLSRLRGSIDYYNINVTHAIGIVTNTVATSQCFNTAINPDLSNSNYYCQLISRDPNTGQIINIVNPELNLGGYRTSGVDFEADWSIPLDAIGLDQKYGTVTFSLVANYLADFHIQTLPKGPSLQYAGAIGNVQIDQFADAHPTWKGAATMSWQVGPVTSNLHWRYIDGMKNASNVGNTGTAHGVPSVSYFDLDAAWQVRHGLELQAGIVNLFDKDPPVLNNNIVGNYATDPYTYDLLGRRFYVALKAHF